MLADYLQLGLSPDAGDEEIRKAYLGLIRRHTPERDPMRFQAIAAAYERIKDEPSRIQSALFGAMQNKDVGQALEDLTRAATAGRRRVGLKTLLEAVAQDRG